jgi:hypothetical protein
MTEHAPDANFVETFKQALADYDGWGFGGLEPRVVLKSLRGQEEPKISSMASRAMDFGDCPLPVDVCNYLIGLMDDTGENPQMKVDLKKNPTWKTAGRVFGKLIADRNKRFGNAS